MGMDGEPEAILGTDFMDRCERCGSVDLITKFRSRAEIMAASQEHFVTFECRTCGFEFSRPDLDDAGPIV